MFSVTKKLCDDTDYCDPGQNLNSQPQPTDIKHEMNKISTPNYLLAAALILACLPALAATPGLWDGAAALPPDSLHVPTEEMAPESFEYVPLSPIHFDSGKATITHQGQRSLDAAVDYLRRHANIKRILVEGHTDEVGGKTYNDGLSDRRARIVRNYLTVKGIDPELINLIGKGEYHPVDQNWTRDGRRRNRHVSIYAVHWQR